MCSQSTTAVFTHNWLAVALGNAIETIYFITFYCVYFADTTTLGIFLLSYPRDC